MTQNLQRMLQPDRWGRAIFCEDIRVDQTGQLHLFGCFMTGVITVQKFPAVIPKLGVFVEMVQSTKIPQELMTVRGYLPDCGIDDHFFEAEIFEETDGRIPDTHEISDYGILPGEPIFRALTATITTPVRIKKAGRILVRGFIGDTYYPLGSIQVLEAASRAGKQEEEAPKAP